MEMPAARALARLRAAGRRFGGAFLDPPYGAGWVGRTLDALDAAALLTPDAWIVVEHGRDEPAPEAVGRYPRQLARRYGDTHVAVYAAGAPSEEPHGDA
jgi:16S rRNA G966 N2-methylase RsmD